jgi:hypothetical protein
MDTDQLFKPQKHAFYLAVLDNSAFADLYLQLTLDHPEAAIRRIRGEKCTTATGFFDEVSAALQFPYYFGDNWDSFEECVNDLSWMRGKAYILMVTDAPRLLQDAEARHLHVLMDILAGGEPSRRDAGRAQDETRQVPFNFVFQCRPAEVDAFGQRLTDAGVKFETL